MYLRFCLSVLVSDRAVLNGNDVFSILLVSAKKWYSSFSEKVFGFQKIYFKVKVLKTFETSIDCHMPISQTESYFESPFLEEPMLFRFRILRQNQLKFCHKITERSNHLFLLFAWWITFARYLYDNRIKRTWLIV